MGTDERTYTIFIDGTEITALDDTEWEFESDGEYNVNTISTEVVMSTKYGDVKFTGVFTMDEYAKLCDVYEKVMSNRGDTQ